MNLSINMLPSGYFAAQPHSVGILTYRAEVMAQVVGTTNLSVATRDPGFPSAIVPMLHAMSAAMQILAAREPEGCC